MVQLTRRQKEIYQFLREFIIKHGYSPNINEIAERFNLSSPATVTEHLQNLVKAGVIMRGTRNSLVRLPDEAYDIAGPSFQKKGKEGRVGQAKSGEQRGPQMIAIPFYGKIAAGSPIEAINDAAEPIYVSTQLASGNCYLLQVSGDSMIEDGIWDGDLLIIKHCNQAEQGQTIVALIDGTAATVKKFFKKGRQVTLEPANQRLRPLVLPASRVQIQGIVQAVIRKYPPNNH